MNVKQTINIFFLSLIDIHMLIKSSKIHMAHGLNPSIKPNIIAIKIILAFLASILPNIGIVYVLSVLVFSSKYDSIVFLFFHLMIHHSLKKF